MNRILQIGMTDNLGGIETFIMNYYRNVDKKKVQFDFINIYKNDLCFQKEIMALGGKIYKVSNYYKHPIKYIKEVIKIIKNNKYEIVHCNMNSAVMLYPLIAAKLAKTKIIIAHSHNTSSDKGILKEMLHSVNKHFIPLLANFYFACSKKAGEWFYSDKLLNSDSFYIINNAIDITKYAYNEKTRKKKRKELGIKEDILVIGHVGRFNLQKNHSFLIDVFDEFHKKHKNSILMLIGDGPLKNEIESKVQELNLKDSVLFLGKRNDVSELMQVMDAFLLPSLYEGLPLVGVEAQAAGLFCIFSNNITTEIEISRQIMFMPLVNSPKEWAIAISKKIKDNVRVEKKQYIYNDNYDIKIATNKLTNIYKFQKGK